MPAWLIALDRHLPIRYLALLGCATAALLGSFAWIGFGVGGWWALLGWAGVITGAHDLRQRRHAVLRNYPVIGHMRFLLEFIRPEIRQYFIESDNEAAPFSRQQRSLVYQRAKGEPDKRPLGTQLDLHRQGYEWLNHSLQPTVLASHDFRITIGEGRAQPYSASVFNISAMSFGALSANAILALNAGARRGGFMHDTGEGSVSRYHREHGGDLVWEIASGYFGCRDDAGRFDPDKFAALATDPQIKLIEVKLSQGAKPGHGGVLPGPKVTPEIARIRGIPVGKDSLSPNRHPDIANMDQLLDRVVHVRRLTGKPVGVKTAIGGWEFMNLLTEAVNRRGLDHAPDFLTIDGGEGGSGAAPQALADHLALSIDEALPRVVDALMENGLKERIKVIASGQIVTSARAAWALAAGGEAALTDLLRSWQRELQLAMTLAGVTRVSDIGPAHLD